MSCANTSSQSFTMKTNTKTIIFIVIVFVFVAAVHCEIVKFKDCPGNVILNCNITQVRVTPCPEAATNKACITKKGTIPQIEFDFWGEPNVSNLTTEAYWATEIADLPLVGMDTVGCKYTQCPTTDSQQTFKYGLEIKKKFPVADYNVKWKLWSKEEMNCCFIFRIKVRK